MAEAGNELNSAEAIQMPVTAERVWRALNLKQFDASPFTL